MNDLTAFFSDYMPLTREDAMDEFDLIEHIREEGKE